MNKSIKLKNKYNVEIVIEPDENGFHVYCPALKGLHVGGETEEEAIKNAGDALIAFLESFIKHNDSLPAGVISRC